MTTIIPQGSARQSRTIRLGDLIDKNNAAPAKIKRNKLIEGFKTRIVYIVRDSNQPLYVGSTMIGARYRLMQHMNSKTPLGQQIKMRFPSSLDWQVEMIAVNGSQGELRQLENELICILRPILNER